MALGAPRRTPAPRPRPHPPGGGRPLRRARPLSQRGRGSGGRGGVRVPEAPAFRERSPRSFASPNPCPRKRTHAAGDTRLAGARPERHSALRAAHWATRNNNSNNDNSNNDNEINNAIITITTMNNDNDNDKNDNENNDDKNNNKGGRPATALAGCPALEASPRRPAVATPVDVPSRAPSGHLCLSMYPSILPSIHLSIRVSVHPSLHLPIYPSHLPIYPSIHLSLINTCVHLGSFMSIHMST